MSARSIDATTLVRRAAAALAILTAAGWGTAQTQESASPTPWLKQAMALTAQGQHAEAETIYRRAADEDCEAIPHLARFLQRTGRASEAEPLIAEAARRCGALIAGRTSAAAGDTTRAITILTEDGAQGDVYRRTVLALSLSEQIKDADGAARVLDASLLDESLTPASRADLVRKFLRRAQTPEHFARATSAVLLLAHAPDADYRDARRCANELLIVAAQQEQFAQLRTAIDSSTDAAAAWLAGLTELRTGDAGKAVEAFETGLARAAGNSPIERSLLHELAALPAPPEVREERLLRYEAAGGDHARARMGRVQIALRADRCTDAQGLLATIAKEKLGESDRMLLSMLRLETAACSSPPLEVVRAYEEEAQSLRFDAAADLAAPIFRQLFMTEQHRVLKAAIDQRLTDADAPAVVYVLLAATMDQLRDPDGLTAAIEQYVARAPDDYSARAELSGASIALAMRRAPDPETTEPAEITPAAREAAEAAARRLWDTIQAKPYDVQAYSDLIRLYKTYGETDKARRATDYLTANPAATAEEIHIAAFVKATNGFAEDSIPLYEKALGMDPGNPRYRLNYAGALTRIGRFEDALNIYLDLMKYGYAGRQFHIHETYYFAYQLALERELIPYFHRFLESIREDQAVAQHEEFLFAAGSMLLHFKQPGIAEKFFETAARLYPDSADEARGGLFDCKLAAKDWDGAQTFIAETARAGETSEVKRIESLIMTARLAMEQGRRDEADAVWRQIADNAESGRMAARALFAAARDREEVGAADAARTLLNEILTRNLGDPDIETLARELLSEIDAHHAKPELPGIAAHPAEDEMSVFLEVTPR